MISPAQKIFEADSESFYDFVSKNGRGLYIPPYQREYAWDKDNVERLIDDTVQGLSALLKRPDESITFIGTIIAMNDVKKSTINPLVRNQIYSQVMTIIDGQQRLTTLLMLVLSLLVEMETQWAELNRAKACPNEETKFWLETRVNDMRGLLSQMLSERQNNGEGAYRYFPKMIRAFKDTWSYEADKASYQSPIAWLLFEYVQLMNRPDAPWGKFLNELKKSQDAVSEEGPGRRHALKMMKVLQTQLKALPTNDEFPALLKIAREPAQQEALFGEEFPDAMRIALESILAKQEHGLMLDERGDLELQVEDTKHKKWWEAATELLSLLVFSRFALYRITLVVVKATTEDFAFDVFEALNTTGQPLTAIETFTPKVVQTVGLASYNASEEKKLLDKASSYLRKVTKAEERQKRSAELIVAFALAEKGEKRSKNLAEQRRFMRDTFETCKDKSEKQAFIRHLADLAGFLDSVWSDSGVYPHIGNVKIGDPAALCIQFLVDLNHTITAPLLAQYAAEVTATLGDPERNEIALSEFESVVKAVTAFTVLWRASRTTTDRIDQVYRNLMSQGDPTRGVGGLARGLRDGKPLPDSKTVKEILMSRLQADRADGGAGIANKQEWVDKVVTQPLYEVNETLARFLLFIAFHDSVDAEEGLLVNGKEGSHPTLTFERWAGDRYSSVEHIAPQSKSKDWSAALYENDEIDRLGNLTLLPLSANQSVSDRPWNHKKLLFCALAAATPEEAQTFLAELQSNGVNVSEVAKAIHSGQFLPHLKALTKVTKVWDSDMVEARGRTLAELAWKRLSSWLPLVG
ncbi:DUF262 domain-containing protein [Terriglobus tenax]|uniref:DUF262 domain-containing protein n=1 Tax=Terriglobus tenax TaxID=1111115 RepID=UPI0021DF9E7C|nr:DUF262 domain-containing HNH endonuclease family protein [Terriglobus tenax]